MLVLPLLTTAPAQAWAPAPMSPAPDVTALHAQLCSTCRTVWLEPRTRQAEAVVGPVEDCFQAVNTSCHDCMRPTCSHAYWHVDPQPVSKQFSFCSGHAASLAAEMSTIAWMRVIDWRRISCAHTYGLRPGDGRSAYHASRSEEQGMSDAAWLRYNAPGTSGWREEWDLQRATR